MGTFYGVVYEFLAMTFCTSGICGHCFSIIILSRMLNPTNLLLISMSCSQLILCVNFFASTLHKYGSDELCLSFLSSYFWVWLFLVSVNLAVVMHMVGVFHVVALSIIRYLSLRQLSTMNSNSVWFTYQKCIKTISIIYALVIILCGPIYFNSNVTKANPVELNCVQKNPQLADHHTFYELSFSSNEQLHTINYWWFGTICKLAPCFVLFIMTILILKQLTAIREMSARFSNAEKDRQHHRTTKIILVVMIVFIIVELPQGILNIVQSLFTIPTVIWDVFELCTLITSCLIFGLFLTMNSRLREAFNEVLSKNLEKFTPKCCAPKSPDSAKDHLFEATSGTEGCRLTNENSRVLPSYGNTGF